MKRLSTNSYDNILFSKHCSLSIGLGRGLWLGNVDFKSFRVCLGFGVDYCFLDVKVLGIVLAVGYI